MLMGMSRILGLAASLYEAFEWMVPIVTRLYPGLADRLRAVGIRVYPKAYAGMVGFWLLVTTATTLIISIAIFLTGVGLLISTALLITPSIIFLILLYYPSIMATNVKAGIEAETPYLASYLSVMSTGGIPPYTALQRVAISGLMPRSSEIGRMTELYMRARGVDQLTALETIAKIVPEKEIGDLLRGYTSTVRLGGDVVHYLLRRTELVFKRRAERVRALVDRFSILMEAYLASSILLALGLYMMFIVSRAIPMGAGLMGVETFFTFSYLVLPFINALFLYIADTMQIKYPSYDVRPYYVLLLLTPAFAISLLSFFLADLFPPLATVFSPFLQLRSFLIRALGLSPGFDAAFGLIISSLILFTPAAVYEVLNSMRERGIFSGVTSFLREVVEVRKTGISPERAIERLAEMDFRQFTPILRAMANKLAWGATYQSIYEFIKRRVRNWLTKLNLFIFFDAIEVGGGTPDTLETLARFSEEIETIESTKRSSLRPLLLIPYIGMSILVFTSISLLGFMREILLQAGRPLAFDQFLRVFLPPIVLNSVMMGLVAGKLSEESVAAGFKHVVLILLIVVITFVASPIIMTLFVPRT
jgi:flagellar protein FlaJ